MKRVRTRKTTYAEVRAYADQQIVAVRKKAEALVKREVAKLRERFATKAELRREVERLDQADVDQAQNLRDFVDLIDDRFDATEH